QLQLLEPLRGEGNADEAPPVAGHEVDGLGGHLFCGDDQVALVLPVGIVHHDDHFAGPDVFDGFLDGGRRQRLLLRTVSVHWLHPPRSGGAASPWGRHRSPSSFSTYLPSTSTSTFTREPGCSRPRVVTAHVWGMRATWN